MGSEVFINIFHIPLISLKGTNTKEEDLLMRKGYIEKMNMKIIYSFKFYTTLIEDDNDIPAHPNVVVFITHVGLLGKIEAVYHGVPMLGLPVYWDQKKNINDAVRHGYALSIPFPDLTEENFEWSLNELINNPM